MIIDLHCHTKNAKDGDTLREVDSLTFSNTIINHGVQIVAITNHNMFDLTQFDLFSISVAGNAILWPGVELDVIGDKSGKQCHGHIIVICDPIKKDDFSHLINNICNINPNDFTIKIDDLSSTFSSLEGCLFICHYHKNPELSSQDIIFLKNNISESDLVILEPSNSRKAGLVIYEDDFGCWFGSDVKNWAEYPNENPKVKLPDCLFNISSFESFKTLLKKDKGAVLLKTLMSPKEVDNVKIKPFDNLELDIPLYKDVNIIFGGKATGKTIILQSFEEYFSQKNKIVHSYYIERKQDDLKNLVHVSLSGVQIKQFEEKSCKEDIDKIKNWSWEEIPTLRDFYKYEKYVQESNTAKRLKITSAYFSELLVESDFESQKKEKFLEIKKIKDFKSISVDKYLSDEEILILNNLLKKVLNGYENDMLQVLYDYYGKSLEKWSIDFLSNKFSSANSVPKKPISIGLIDTYTSLLNLKKYLYNIRKNKSFSIDINKELIGILPLKGNVYRKVFSGFEKQKNPSKKSYDITNGKRVFVNGNFNTENISRFNSSFETIKLDKNSEEITQDVNNFKKTIQEDKIVSLMDFLNYSIFLQTDTVDDFKPSNGVVSILLVDSAVRDSKCDVIILDEPDGGMGADFVNETLIPEINKRASENKIILIGTHDANLVVRTHPYCCIYREEPSSDEYETYVGNSFEENLISIKDNKITKRWVDACVEKCEGGINALQERERTYGRD